MPKQLTADLVTGDIIHEWVVPEYEEHQDRGPWWYIVMITVGLALVVYSIITLNFLFALIIILAAIIIFLQSHESPINVDFVITELGIIVGTRFYPYTELDTFYIIYNPPTIKTLFIQTTSKVRPMIRVPLLDQNPIDIRQTLLANLKEDLTHEEEPLSDTVARNLKLQ